MAQAGMTSSKARGGVRPNFGLMRGYRRFWRKRKA